MYELFFNSFRPFSVVVGLLLMFFSGKRLRDFTTARVQDKYLFVAGVLLIVISALHVVIRSTARLFGLSPAQNGGIILSMILAIGILFMLILQLLDKSEVNKRKLDLLNREFSLTNFYTSDEYKKIPQKDQRQVLCIVPSYNEAENLSHLIDRFSSLIDFGKSLTVLLVDDGSSDNTRDIVVASPCVYFRQMTNRGQGSALRAGYELAINLGYQYVVTIDADGQNNPEEIPSLVEPLMKDEADMVIGSRILGKHDITVVWRHWGVKFFTALFNLLSGQQITDISSGFKAIKVSSLKLLNLHEDQFQASEFLMLSAKTGARFREVPIHFKQRHSGKSKKGNDLSYAIKFCSVLFFTWIRYR
ncbi:glycosyltransferase family 2 protein [Rhodanobacter ginsengisoli]|uniref:Glycosyltransferase family 2 protein n=1 Tax=Rhodanobacter ginsengisoli TaxID=418646 RepID=A0ABW0QRT8_9GAMM